jgi:alpha-L-fucosidase 2
VENVEFRNLRAEGAFLISAVRRNGRVTRVEVVAEKGGMLRMVSPKTGRVVETAFRPGQRRVF